MNVRIIATAEEFWRDVLCDYRCYRASLRVAYIGNTMYMALQAPEEVPGFLDAKLEEISKALGGQPGWKDAVLEWLVACFPLLCVLVFAVAVIVWVLR